MYIVLVFRLYIIDYRTTLTHCLSYVHTTASAGNYCQAKTSCAIVMCKITRRADPAEVEIAQSEGCDVIALEGVGKHGRSSLRLCPDLLHPSAFDIDTAVAALNMSACCLPII